MSETKDPKKVNPIDHSTMESSEGPYEPTDPTTEPTDPSDPTDSPPTGGGGKSDILPIDDSAFQGIGFVGKIAGTMIVTGEVRPKLKIHSSAHDGHFTGHDIPAMSVRDKSLNPRNIAAIMNTTVWFEGVVETHGGIEMYVAKDVSLQPLNGVSTY